jgi:16S rRNA C1402 (ribose-2'-O) methylase RsmI
LFAEDYVDIGEKTREKYRGSLVVVPTPLGNLNDISLRQFEALTSYADIIACEDTRKTGKMLELLLEKQMKSKFRSTFGAEFETFFDDDQ